MNEPRESSIPGVPEWSREAAASRGGRDIKWQPRPVEMQCEHPDVRYFKAEKGAIACMVCGRLCGHLNGATFTAYNEDGGQMPEKPTRLLLKSVLASLIIGGVCGAMVALAGGPHWAAIATTLIVYQVNWFHFKSAGAEDA